MPNLKYLYAGSNVNVRKLNGLDECRNLEVLHLRGCAVFTCNQIGSIEIQPESFTNLKYINFRENDLKSIKEIEKLNGFKTLETVIVSHNPYISDNHSSYIYEILSRISDIENILTLNKHPVNNAMRAATAHWMVGKKSEARLAQKEKDEKERK